MVALTTLSAGGAAAAAVAPAGAHTLQKIRRPGSTAEDGLPIEWVSTCWLPMRACCSQTPTPHVEQTATAAVLAELVTQSKQFMPTSREWSGSRTRRESVGKCGFGCLDLEEPVVLGDALAA